ncbi:LuxR C-terminal-related transcriptional regulator [Streptomyces sp. VRA16 Mangrove soil]|uniref:ATP-binding protein n=1 Tax=Streptomyces sp. VRA16 Mangrove soil TaxID=2817434 RepID=UPI001A9D92BC|nr:LuxR C-terminal-related transcriptional regulator [Streptomyces sp. VRA16 Mangrove soil]MBO1329826.1 LuxR family transcriptional regulator [Streptomyces sp. VRA16 Mangrove soil]
MATPGLKWQRSQLPAESTSLIGRDADVATVRALLAEARMVTLLGPGGVGKTRVAIRAAAGLGADFPDGVQLIELSGVSGAAMVPHAVAASLGLSETDGRGPLDLLVEHFAEARALLVLDTCEHQVDACALLAEILLSSCPGLKLLLTSRQALDVPAEHVLSVQPLGLSASVALFAERGAASRPGFAITVATRPLVESVCRRLDGMPLALELAAVQLRALALEQLERRLADRFRALGRGRTVHPRHQTLRTAIDWSHGLCSPEEQELWARLSVFAGGFDLATAEAVCADGTLDPYDLVDHLIGLVDKSIVIREESDEGAGAGESGDRYRMLDTLREYGAERLAAAGAADELALRHRDHFLRLALRSAPQFHGARQVEWTHRLDRDSDNFRAALEWSLTTPGEAAAAVRLCGALDLLWFCAGRANEGTTWSERVAAAAPEAPVADRAKLADQFARLRFLRGDITIAAELARYAAVLYGDANAPEDAAYIRAFAAEVVVRLVGDPSAARESEAELGRLVNDGADVRLRFRRHCLIAARLEKEHDIEGALAEHRRAATALPVGEVWWTVQCRLHVTKSEISAGRPEVALREGRTALRLLGRLGDRLTTGEVLMLLALVSIDQERFVDAAVLQGAADASRRTATRLWEQAGPGMRELYGPRRARAEAALGSDLYARHYEEGRALGLPAAVARALSRPPEERAPTEPVECPLDRLTRREREVAALVHQGMSNRTVAEHLVISKRTVDAHVEHILAKLGFASRSQIVALLGDMKGEAVAAEFQDRTR